MNYGDFASDGREFVITRPDTPRPWINYLSNGNYCALISQTGGGYSFIGGPGYDRIIRTYPGEMLVRDVPGRYIYVRDNDSGEFWSLTWQPVRMPPEEFECRHSPGVTVIRSRNNGITGSITYFVSLEDNLEVWRVTIGNTRRRRARLTIFTYQEWALGNYTDDLQDRAYFNLFNEVDFRDNFIVATKRIWRRPDLQSVAVEKVGPKNVDPKFMPETIQSNQNWGKSAFISLSVPVEAFDCDKEAFLGTYGSHDRPAAVVRGMCSNSDGYGRDPVGVLQHSLELKPGESQDFDVIAGIALADRDVAGIVARLSEPGEIAGKLDRLRQHWDGYLGQVKVSTPDPPMDPAMNVWGQYQCSVTGDWSRMASYYVAGSSIVGFRDTCHDLLGVLPLDKPLAKSHIATLLQHQYDDGSCVHYWEPRSDVGTYAGQSDDPLWLVFAVISYLKETGDVGFLDERTRYYYGRDRVTVYEHIVRAMDHVLSRLSSRGLCLMGSGDWNDALDQVGRRGKGESVMTSELLAWTLHEAVRLADFRKDHRRAAVYKQRYAAVKKAINDRAWDGEWYIRAFDDNGRAVGSSANQEGKIYLNAQSWAVISRIASKERATRCLDAVSEHLDTPFGPAVLSPAYSRPDRDIGTLTRFASGLGMNGSIATLPAAWAVIAECILGRGDRAYDLFSRSLFTERSRDRDRYKAEPYVHADYVCGPGSPRFGEGQFTWTTESSPWMWRAGLDYILGVQPDFPGLLIDPCIPSSWREFKVVRPFRNATYEITVYNPEGVCKGVKRIQVGHTSVEPGHTLPAFADGKTHRVTVEMGKGK